jgi:hypothetical protein
VYAHDLWTLSYLGDIVHIKLIVAAAMLSGALVAHADTISTFNLSGIQSMGSSIVGTLTIDTTSGLFTAGDFTVNTQGGHFLFDSAPFEQLPGVYQNIVFQDSAGDQTIFAFPTNSFVNYTGGNLCAGTCTFGSSSESSAFIPPPTNPVLQRYGFTGSLTFVSSTSTSTVPEPSSIALVASGLLGAVTLRRRRIA